MSGKKGINWTKLKDLRDIEDQTVLGTDGKEIFTMFCGFFISDSIDGHSGYALVDIKTKKQVFASHYAKLNFPKI